MEEFKTTTITGSICSICTEPFAEPFAELTTKCNHNFHKKCLEDWINIKNICPLCRITEPLVDFIDKNERCCSGYIYRHYHLIIDGKPVISSHYIEGAILVSSHR